jgi:hypothetical protein
MRSSLPERRLRVHFYDRYRKAKQTQAQLSPERTNWNYVPMRRAGVPLADLDTNQRTLVDPLLRSALSPTGYKTAQQIVQHSQNAGHPPNKSRRRTNLRRSGIVAGTEHYPRPRTAMSMLRGMRISK